MSWRLVILSKNSQKDEEKEIKIDETMKNY